MIQQKWELLKFGAATFAQDWSREKAQETKFVSGFLYEKLAEMEENLNKDENLGRNELNEQRRT